MSDPIITLLEQDTVEPNARVTLVCEAISARHPDRVQAFIYYGSSLRDMDNPEKMLDFYVLVDSYRKTHKSFIRAALNRLIPPAVYYYEQEDEDGVLSTCKYSLLSLSEFEKKCSSRAFLSQVWGRFSQPCVLMFPIDDTVKTRVMQARALAVRHMAQQTAPLITDPNTSSTDFWARGYHESYRTELRPESSQGRSREIVQRFEGRYRTLFESIYTTLPNPTKLQTHNCRTKWFFRRLLGKPLGAIRILNSAATFDGGLDYVMRKLKRHSGVSIEVSNHQRRHPILWSPVLAWKYWRKGAFR